MIEDMQSKLDEIGKQFDKRTSYCELAIMETGDGRWRLTGRVQDATTLTRVVDQLSRTYAGQEFETAEVEALRPGRQITVGTSVAGLYAGPSFGQEMASQLLSGSMVEELISEDAWAFVRQPDGYLGWVYRPYLSRDRSPRPTHLVRRPISLLRAHPDHSATLCGRVAGGTAVRTERIEGNWAQLTMVGGNSGWVPTGDLRAYGELPEDEAGRRALMVADAATFTGVPYLWGGITAYGLDCSGLVQLTHRLVGVTIPRDADMQYDAGAPVEPPFKPGDLLFFASQNGRRSITHVGMSLGGWHIIHSSRLRNGVFNDDVKAASWLDDVFVGACTFLN